MLLGSLAIVIYSFGMIPNVTAAKQRMTASQKSGAIIMSARRHRKYG
jgi:hypothetical protein